MVRQYRFSIEPVVRANGNCPSREFYDGLDREVRGKFIAIWHRIERSSNGTLRDSDKLWKLRGEHASDLWEMRAYYNRVWYRILCFRDGPKWMLTHGFTKDTTDTERSEIDKGVAIKKEYEAMQRNKAARRR